MNRISSRGARAFAVAVGLASVLFTSLTSADTAPPPGHNPYACQSWAAWKAAEVYNTVYQNVLASCRQSGGSYCEGPAASAASQAQTQAYNYYYNYCMTY